MLTKNRIIHERDKLHVIFNYIAHRYSIQKFQNYVYILISIVLYLFNITFSQTAFKTYLAFSINIIHANNIESSCKKIKSIEFKGIHNIVKRQIITQNGTYTHNVRCVSNCLCHFIYYLKLSGFVCNSRFYSLRKDNIEYNIQNIILNPYVKKIVIHNSNKIKIPKNLLNLYFFKHLGLPRNYYELNKSISCIYTWYKNKGFDYIVINLTRNRNAHCIDLVVHEGTVENVYLVCASKLKIHKDKLNLLENRIKEELSINVGSIFNINQLKLGIKKLYDINLISKCKYKIIVQNNKISIVLIYQIDTGNISHIKTKYINFIKKSKRNNINISSNLLSNAFKYTRSYISLYLPIEIRNDFTLKAILPYQFNLFGSYLKTLEKTFHFKYSKSLINHNNFKNILYDIKFIHGNTIFDLHLSCPIFHITKSMFIDCFIHLYQNIYNTKITYLLNIYTNPDIDKLTQYIHNWPNKSFISNIIFQHKLHNFIDLNEKISIIHNSINQHCILANRIHLSQKLNHLHHITTLYKKAKQKILKIDLFVKLHYCYYSSIIKEGSSLICQISSIIYLPFNKLSKIEANSLLQQYINLQYHKFFFIKPFIHFTKSHKNAIVVSTEFYWPIKSIYYWLLSLQTSSSHFKPYKYPYIILSSHSNKMYLLDVEYHLILNQHYSIYIFSNYIYKYKTYANSSSTNYIQTYLYPYSIYYNNTINLGSGLQFNIPVRNISPLCIEYCISNYPNKTYQLRVYSKYTDYKTSNARIITK